MALTKHLLTVGMVGCLALAGPAWSAGDRAAFENSVAQIAKAVSGPNPISFLVGLGDFYCQMKHDRGGGPLDVQTAAAAFHRTHPGSSPNRVAEDAAMSEANKLLCPD